MFVSRPEDIVGNSGSYACYRDFYPTLQHDTYRLAKKYCEKKKINLGVYIAMLKMESGFKRTAHSPKGAIGIAQVMPFHYKKNPDRLYDKEFNIDISTEYYCFLMKISNNNTAYALARYHAGHNKNLSQYTHWIDYVFPIMENAKQSSGVLNG